MSETIAKLHAEYAALASRPDGRLNADQTTSLRYYRTDINREPHPAVRVAAWIRSLHDLETFVGAFARMPRENNRIDPNRISSHERQLAEWVRTQRKALTQGRRCTYQQRRLACISEFSTAPFDDLWTRRLEEYERFINANKGAPNSSIPNERTLAAWAAKQRLRHRAGRLNQSRVVRLELLSVWSWGFRSTGRATLPADLE